MNSAMRCQRRNLQILISFVLLMSIIWKFNMNIDLTPLASGIVKTMPNIRGYELASDIIENAQASLDPWQKELCPNMSTEELFKDDLLTVPLMYRDLIPDAASKNIFLIDSSCTLQPTYRALCTAESWALNNQDKMTWFVVTSPLLNDPTRVMRRLLDGYPNLKIIGANLTREFMYTPLWDLFRSYRWKYESKWPINIMGNMLRLALIWNWGGTYTDFDIICIRKLGKFSNTITQESKLTINNAVLQGYPRSQAYWKFMEDIKNKFNGFGWGQTGPLAMTRVMKKLCNSTDFKDIAEKKIKCGDMTILTIENFYPIHYGGNAEFFKEQTATNIETLFPSSYGLHFWNNLTKKKAIRKGSNSILETAAKKFCPLTHRMAFSHSNFF